MKYSSTTGHLLHNAAGNLIHTCGVSNGCIQVGLYRFQGVLPILCGVSMTGGTVSPGFCADLRYDAAVDADAFGTVSLNYVSYTAGVIHYAGTSNNGHLGTPIGMDVENRASDNKWRITVTAGGTTIVGAWVNDMPGGFDNTSVVCGGLLRVYGHGFGDEYSGLCANAWANGPATSGATVTLTISEATPMSAWCAADNTGWLVDVLNFGGLNGSYVLNHVSSYGDTKTYALPEPNGIISSINYGGPWSPPLPTLPSCAGTYNQNILDSNGVSMGVTIHGTAVANVSVDSGYIPAATHIPRVMSAWYTQQYNSAHMWLAPEVAVGNGIPFTTSQRSTWPWGLMRNDNIAYRDNILLTDNIRLTVTW